MIDIAGGILIALVVLVASVFGLALTFDKEGESQGCGLALLIVAGLLLWGIFG